MGKGEKRADLRGFRGCFEGFSIKIYQFRDSKF